MKSILSLNYARRRVVVIGPSSKQEYKKSSVKWGNLITFSFLIGFGFDYLTIKPLKRNIKQDNNSDTVVVSLEQALAELTFPPGHPQLDTAYIGHPLDPSRYVPLASFHNVIFEQKVNDLVTLLASLGAERLRVHFKQGYSTGAGLSFDVSVPVDELKVDAGMSVGGLKEKTRDAVIEESFRPTKPPSIPEGLVWYEHEPSWQGLARRRIEFGTQSFNTTLVYNDDFNINTKLKLKLQGFGVQLGGEYTDFKTTIWEFDGTYADF